MLALTNENNMSLAVKDVDHEEGDDEPEIKSVDDESRS